MLKRTVWMLLLVALLVGFQGLVAQTASAHGLLVTATGACGTNGPVINYTVTSWELGDFTGSNPEIDVLFNGIKVASGAFSLLTNPQNQFSGQQPAPSGATVTVEGLAFATWADGFPGGQTNIVSVPIPTNCSSATGRFTGGGKQVEVGGLTITKALELDCDLNHPNNLEINWQDAAGAHQFHMEVFVSANCFLNPAFSPTPPTAPINTMIGVGTGRVDGVLGYTVEFTLEDHGEPGTQDMAGFKIHRRGGPGTVVLNFPLQLLTKGKLQAHVDQH
jgi:hypothetical protein